LKRPYILCRLVIPVILVFIFSSLPLPVKADGGPVVGPYLWASMKEGQQIAVVTLRNTETAEVDLFVSLLDSTGESHEVVFFVPLGIQAVNFSVYEQDSLTFDKSKTKELDTILHEDTQRKQGAIRSLFGATLLTNGIWLLPLWLPVILSGCASAPPEATLKTDSSQVSVYGLDDNTDLDELISTSGLDPSVRDTLSRLRGQRIAVVTLQTQPRSTSGNPNEPWKAGESGIRLSWTTSLAHGESGATYTYPLGTGAAWSHPIEMTRVYVTAPPAINFSVEYPRLGANRSGYEGNQQRISKYYDSPAYAVDDAFGSNRHVWRVVYTQSNATEDIIITARPQSSLSRIYISLQKAGNSGIALPFGFIIALAFWLLGWRYLMPRLLNGSYQRYINQYWKYALMYTWVNILLMIPGIILYLFWSMTGNNVTLAFLFILFGGVSLIIFAARHAKHLGASPGQAIKVYMLVTLASNGAYLVLAIAYAKLTSII
jgi:hypothetical protein